MAETLRPNVQSSSEIANISIGALIFLSGILIAVNISAGDLGIGTLIVFSPIIVGLVALVLANPYYGLLFYIHYNFFFLGLSRYITGIPLGISVDFVLLISTLSMLIRLNADSVRRMNSGVFYLAILWFVYTLFEIFNTDAPNPASWLYAVRGISVYAVLALPLTLVLLDTKEKLATIINIIIVWGVISSLWGMRQVYVGFDPFEQKWLNEGGALTHLIEGQIRAFSFYSDAGQYGGTISLIAFVAFIMALGPFSKKLKTLYLVAFLICVIGFSLSGTRGSLYVLLSGGIAYLLLVRRFRILLVGGLFALSIFVILKFTYVGNTNYQVYRLRTALDPNDPSLIVRLDNQDLLRDYLSTRPFGTGIGTTDYWAKRFYPSSFLVNVQTDSWFVRIWVENGVVGLAIHALLLAYVLVVGFIKIRKIRDEGLKYRLMALYGGYVGIIMASFGNPIFGQAPLSAIMYVSMAIISGADVFETPERKVKRVAFNVQTSGDE